jgi:hypothetical protein
MDPRVKPAGNGGGLGENRIKFAGNRFSMKAARCRARSRSFKRDVAVDLMRKADTSHRDRRFGLELLVALELPVGDRLPHRFLDFALRRDTERFQKLPNADVESVLVHVGLHNATVRQGANVAFLKVRSISCSIANFVRNQRR